jgi:SAM-dependent methyltransferase
VNPEVVFHDLECGGYRADLALWRELAGDPGRPPGPVLDVGAGTGRVALDLARAGHEVVALDRDPVLLAALRERAAAEELGVQAVEADARDFELGRAFGLVLAPMQTAQLLGGREGRAGFLAAAARHLAPGGLLAAALAGPLEPYDASTVTLPEPDVGEEGGVWYASRPVAIREDGGRMALERLRETLREDGGRSETLDVVLLDRLTPAELEAEALPLGLSPEPPRRIPPTADHVGSTVVVLRA